MKALTKVCTTHVTFLAIEDLRGTKTEMAMYLVPIQRETAGSNNTDGPIGTPALSLQLHGPSVQCSEVLARPMG